MALYRCIANGGAAATDITPSNSTPASMSADGVYHATAAGYAIASYNSVTPSNSTPVALTSGAIYKASANGKAIASYTDIVPFDVVPPALSNGNIYRMDGASGYAVENAPTRLTPSNSSPEAIADGGLYIGWGNGYAIESYTDINPQSGATALSAMSIYCALTNGYAIPGYTNITPSNSNPPSLHYYDYYHVPSGTGLAIESLDDVTPSDSSPVAVSSGDICRMGGAGYVIESYSNVTPSDSGPVELTSGDINKMTGNGYAIESFEVITPTAGGVAFTAGMKKMNSGGVVYSGAPTIVQYTHPGENTSSAVTTVTYSWPDMQGKKYLVFLFYTAGSSTSYTRLDGATITGGTLTKLCNLRSQNATGYGTFYNMVANQSSVTITAPYVCFIHVFGTE